MSSEIARLVEIKIVEVNVGVTEIWTAGKGNYKKREWKRDQKPWNDSIRIDQMGLLELERVLW